MLALTSTPLASAVDDVHTGLAITVIGWAGTFLFFAGFRSRVVNWL